MGISECTVCRDLIPANLISRDKKQTEAIQIQSRSKIILQDPLSIVAVVQRHVVRRTNRCTVEDFQMLCKAAYRIFIQHACTCNLPAICTCVKLDFSGRIFLDAFESVNLRNSIVGFFDP